MAIKPSIPWNKIRKEYVEGNAGVYPKMKDLAKKYETNYDWLRSMASKEKWTAARKAWVAVHGAVDMPRDTSRRPELNFKLLDDLCKIHCTVEEIESIIGLSRDVMERQTMERFGLTFSVYAEQKKAGGKMSLRRRQFHAAMNGDKLMQIWLGKQWLNQKDKQDVNQSGDININVKITGV